jgi:hypothetical protein
MRRIRDNAALRGSVNERGTSLARASKAQAPEDLWHLSIDDLFASPAPEASGLVAGPFVINLSLSSAPSGSMPRGMPRFERVCVYQLRRAVEDREEFRLRLGIIQTELEADAILAAVRDHYPAARKETASPEDTAAVAARTARAAQRAEQMQKLQAKQAASSKAAAPVPAKAKPSAPKPTGFVQPEPVVEAITIEVRPPDTSGIIEFELAAPPMPVAPTPGCHDSDPDAITEELEALTFTMDAPVFAEAPLPAAEIEITVEAPRPEATVDIPAPSKRDIDTVTLEVLALNAGLDIEPPPAVAPAPVGEIEIMLSEPAADALLESPAVATSAPAPPPVAVRAPSAPVQWPMSQPARVGAAPATAGASIAIDSTQTQRALTSLDVPEGEASSHFVVQLILSEDEVDPEQVPSLDIFSEYRLYRVKGLDQERVMHALRLGFFSSEPAAEAVAGYMAVYFDAPTIKRVSLAERERFVEDRVKPRKDVGATGAHSVIELTSPAPLPQRLAREVLEPEADETRAKGSIWSRLVKPLKR